MFLQLTSCFFSLVIRCKLDASVTIRPLILTPAQWVSQICTETDVLAADVLLFSLE